MKTSNEKRTRRELRTMDKDGKVTNSAVYFLDRKTGKMFDDQGKEVKEMKLKCLSTKE